MSLLVKPTALGKLSSGSGYVFEVTLGLILASCTYGLPMILGLSLGGAFVAVVGILAIITCSLFSLIYSVTGFLSYWVVLAISQNFFVGIWHGISQDSIPVVVTESKTIALGFAIIWSMRRVFDYLKTRQRLFISLSVYIFIVVIHIRSGDGATLAYLRNFLAPLALAALAATATRDLSRKQRTDYASRLFVSIVALSLIGSSAELILGTDQWRSLLNASASAALNSLSDNTSFMGINLPRTGGILVEPTNAGYVAAMAVLVLALFSPNERIAAGLSRFSLFGIAGGLVVMGLAAAKSGALVLVIAAICLILFKSRLSNTASFFLGWIASFLLTAAYAASSKGLSALMGAFSNPISIVGGDSTTFHLAGFLYGIRSLLGHGIGVGGNFNRDRTQTWTHWLSTGSESSWGVLAYQTGLAGLITWLVVLAILGKSWGRTSAVVICAWSAGAMFAEAMIGPQVAGIAMIGAALLRLENDDATELTLMTQPHLADRSRRSP